MAKPQAIRAARQQERFMNGCFYGIPGIGKSVLVGSAVEVGKTLVLEGPGGESDAMVSHGYNPDTWKITDRVTLDEAYEYCRHEGVGEYDVLVLDCVSLIEGTLMSGFMADAVVRNPERSRLVPDKREYLLTQNTVDEKIKQFVDLPIHFFFTAHLMLQRVTVLDEDGFPEERLMYLPQIQGGEGRLSQKICGYTNIVGLLEADEDGQRSMLVRADSWHVAKDKFECLSDDGTGRMEDPTMKKIAERVTKKLMTSGRPAKKAGAKKAVPHKTTTARRGARAQRS